ncbi:unnamed protein product [Mycena citricolor]|uniref:MYND-type domain-containing protein n=1 Tax=Mycena citricolor TaxID=2018698 RepID=A0AAD2HAP7_9AGAR|nr:unnamed protein product [Mycena citricolor]
MRESNFAFPAQNKACVCITSQLYDRRALDTSAPLPLFNSLTHLTYLTSTSPRIREIMTMDGGLERLVRILRDFCFSPPPPVPASSFFGLLPPNYYSPRPAPQLNPPSGQFDKHAAYRFSLAFQCVVNIGVRGSEPIRSRVVEAGTLDVVGCILEAWLVGRGFAVGPSTSATGLPRESREARAARRAAAAAASRRTRGELDSSHTSQRSLAIDTSAARRADGNHIHRAAATSPRHQGEEDIEAATPIVRDRSATVVVRRRGDTSHVHNSGHNHGRDNTNMYSGDTNANNPVSPAAALQALQQLAAAQNVSLPDGHPPSPSLSALSTTSVTGSPNSTASPDARSRSRASSLASPVSRASPVGSSISSSRASPSPSARTDTDTDGDGDGDVEMVAAAVAGLAMGVSGPSNVTDLRSRIGDSSASASPSPPPLNVVQAAVEQAAMNAANLNANLTAINQNMPMPMMMGLARDPRIVGEEGGMGMAMGLGGDDGMDGDATNMMLNMGMMNEEVGMLGLDGGMMDMNMVMGMGALGMMGGMPIPVGITDAHASGGTDSEARADTDADAEESDAPPISTGRRRVEEEQTQTPRAGVVQLPAPESAVYEEEGEMDEEEGEVVVAVRDRGGSMRRAGTLRAARMSENNDTAEPIASTSQLTARPISPISRPTNPGAPRVPALAPPVTTRSRRVAATDSIDVVPTIVLPPAGPAIRNERHHHSHNAAHQTGPYRDEDVLLSLQLLAYLSKYPHVRQAFYKRRNGFHPASALAVAAAKTLPTESSEPRPTESKARQGPVNQQLAFFRAFGPKEGRAPVSRTGPPAVTQPAKPSNTAPARSGNETNVFSLVERFTFRPSSSEIDLPNPPPKLPPEIQYWAGVIMRNACRKDDSRGGIRQCANMLCGRWEAYPREFAKCRRCRKAKYCGKDCQSTAWSEGHRFWCSAKEGDDAPDATVNATSMLPSTSTATIVPEDPGAGERRDRRTRERERTNVDVTDTSTIRAIRPAAILNAIAGPSRVGTEPAGDVPRSRAMALLRRNGNPFAADTTLHHPQPQNTADIGRYLASFGAPTPGTLAGGRTAENEASSAGNADEMDTD